MSENIIQELHDEMEAEYKIIQSSKKKADDPACWKPVEYKTFMPQTGVKLMGGIFQKMFFQNKAYIKESYRYKDYCKDKTWIEALADLEGNGWYPWLPASNDGRMLGGAMYALERGFKFKTLGKILAVLFALFALLASFGIGSGVQVNAISNIMNNTFDLGTVNLFGQDASVISIIVGVLVAAITAVVIFGGIKSISRVCELLVPFMAVFYVLGCLIILGMNFDVLGKTFEMIFQDAFSLKSVAGGFLGSSLMLAARYGIARGLFSNESGMGSAPIVASAAQTRNPVRQAMISSTGTFWDTVVVCLMTGLVLVSSIIKNPAIDVSDGGDLTYKAFQQIPVIGTPILVIGIAAFAYSTILGWSYYGERCVEYLFGRGGMIPYKLIFVFILLIGPVIKLDLVWTMADIFNALMSIPNLIAVVVLSPVVVKETNYYLYGNRLDEYDKTKLPVVNK